jgi:DNA-binding NtrC family response regulator
VVRVAVPPLRERLDDIPLLIEHFLDEAGYERPLQALFSPVQIEELRRHAWPGNVRELRNVVLGALTLGHPPPLEEGARRDTVETAPAADPIERVLKSSYREARREVLDLFERRYLGALLERNKGNVRAAAREASMDRMYLTELLRRHGLS